MHTQFKKGVLEMCILFQLSDTSKYGYEIMRTIKEVFPDVYDGSIYAILRRLNAENYTETFTKDSDSGPPRKYYRITLSGTKYLRKMTTEWDLIVSAVKKTGIGAKAP